MRELIDGLLQMPKGHAQLAKLLEGRLKTDVVPRRGVLDDLDGDARQGDPGRRGRCLEERDEAVVAAEGKACTLTYALSRITRVSTHR